MTLEQIYNVKTLDDKIFEKETRIQVATVQSMVKRILYNEKEFKPSVTDFDLIIIDEAHRGYILDKEKSTDEEKIFANQQDYQSKYRNVIEYFDSVRIALTATPALHTPQIFGAPIFKYSYREAVIDGYLADNGAPHTLQTNFKRLVVNENFNRVMLEEIAKEIDADSLGKTHFEIYDAVWVYESLEPVSEMKSVVANPAETFENLLEKLKVDDNSTQIKKQINQIIGKFQRAKNKLSGEILEQIQNLIGEVKNLSPQDAKKFLPTSDLL